MTCASFSAMSRTFDISGPLIRYWIGHPTGGPNSSVETRLVRLGNSLASTSSSFFCRRLRAATSLATTTAWLKKLFGSCTLSGR